jgi:putative membrane protein PagO
MNVNVIAYVASALFLGSNWYATRICLHGFKPMTAAALRFAIASAVFIGVWLAGYAGSRPTRSELKWLALSGVLNAIQYTLFYFALVSISGGLAAVIYATVPLFVAFVSILTGIEKIKARSIIGGMLALAGIVFIYFDRLGLSSAQATGVILMAAAVIVSAVSTVILKHHGRRVSPVVTTTIFLTMSAVLLGIGAGIFERNDFVWPTVAKPYIALLYLGLIGSAAGFGVYFAMLKRVSIMTASSIAFVLPVVAIVIDWIGREPLRMTGSAWIGVGLALAGVVFPFLVALRNPPPQKVAAKAS